MTTHPNIDPPSMASYALVVELMRYRRTAPDAMILLGPGVLVDVVVDGVGVVVVGLLVATGMVVAAGSTVGAFLLE